MPDPIEQLLELYSLEEVFDVLDITPHEVVSHLVQSGLVTLPPFLNEDESENGKG